MTFSSAIAGQGSFIDAAVLSVFRKKMGKSAENFPPGSSTFTPDEEEELTNTEISIRRQLTKNDVNSRNSSQSKVSTGVRSLRVLASIPYCIASVAALFEKPLLETAMILFAPISLHFALSCSIQVTSDLLVLSRHSIAIIIGTELTRERSVMSTSRRIPDRFPIIMSSEVTLTAESANNRSRSRTNSSKSLPRRAVLLQYQTGMRCPFSSTASTRKNHLALIVSLKASSPFA